MPELDIIRLLQRSTDDERYAALRWLNRRCYSLPRPEIRKIQGPSFYHEGVGWNLDVPLPIFAETLHEGQRYVLSMTDNHRAFAYRYGLDGIGPAAVVRLIEVLNGYDLSACVWTVVINASPAADPLNDVPTEQSTDMELPFVVLQNPATGGKKG